MLRGLIHHWRPNLAVAAGAAVATAVLTGALLVGDSMRASLRGLTLDRLGEIDHALVVPSQIARESAERLQEQLGDPSQGGSRVVPAIVLRGSAVAADSRRRATRVGIYGIEESFADLFEDGTPLAEGLTRQSGQIFPPAVLNQALAADLGVAPGDGLLLSFEGQDEIPRATLAGGADSQETIEALRATVAAVIPDTGPGRFGLAPSQELPRTLYVPLRDIQRAANRNPRDDRRRWINALLVSDGESPVDLDAAVRQAFPLADLGLDLHRADGRLIVESRDFVLRPPVAEAITAVATEAGATVQPVLSYLANEMAVGDRSTAYATIAAFETPVPEAFGELTLIDGTPAPPLADGDILLDTWTAEDLEASSGDALTLTYYAVGPRDELITRRADFRVAGIVALDGLAVDPRLTPEFPGIAEAGDISSWDPPFPVDLDAVTERDEDYWDRYRAAPKGFVAPAAGARLWSNRFGELTSLRLAPAADFEGSDGLAALEPSLRSELPGRLPLDATGLTFLAVKERGLEGASGATDFTGLFLGFSMFLIASAALLVALLFRLAVERRAPEWGLRLAMGFPLAAVRRQVLTEGLVLAAAGALAGTALAVLYGRLLLRALAVWWSPLIDAPFLELAVEPTTLLIGAVAAVALVAGVLVLAVRRLGRQTTLGLLAGTWSASGADGSRVAGGKARRAAWILGATAALLLAASLLLSTGGGEAAPGLFFALGATLCATGFAAFAAWCRAAGARGRTAEVPIRGSAAALAARNSTSQPGRSLLSVILVACACFVLVSVTANRKTGPQDAADRASGTGGYALVGETDVPVRRDPARFESLEEMGFEAPKAARVAAAGVVPFRLLPGEDASCLNLYQPEEPRVLGAPAEFIERGGFHFRAASSEVDNPWSLLERDLGPGVIPAIGDYASVRWILHLGLGGELELTSDSGEPVRLRIVGLLEGSLFQSELIVAEDRFLEHFASHDGYGYFLVEEGAPEVIEALEEGFEDYGFDGQGTAEKIAAYLAVENMYLTTFQALGGLGLLLGTLGLGVVMVKNVVERRGELAALRAFGFRRGKLARLVVLENAFLLVVGIALGAVAGLAAVAPHLLAGRGQAPWFSLLALLATVFAVGTLAGLAAAWGSLKIPLLETLKND
ncbi:MAG: ABC transporter permease [Acidobacteriota bacterium]